LLWDARGWRSSPFGIVRFRKPLPFVCIPGLEWLWSAVLRTAFACPNPVRIPKDGVLGERRRIGSVLWDRRVFPERAGSTAEGCRVDTVRARRLEHHIKADETCSYA